MPVIPTLGSLRQGDCEFQLELHDEILSKIQNRAEGGSVLLTAQHEHASSNLKDPHISHAWPHSPSDPSTVALQTGKLAEVQPHFEFSEEARKQGRER